MRLGVDIDGVLADFVAGYQPLFVKITGEDKFLPGDIEDPPSWNWPSDRGYTKEQTSQVWERIKGDETFWLNLKGHKPNLAALRTYLWEFGEDHDLYFITSRLGVGVKVQTQEWLRRNVGVSHYGHTTIIVGHRVKGLIAKALQLDAYIDDNLDNVYDVLKEAPTTRTYLLNRRYNQEAVLSPAYTDRNEIRIATRVPDLEAFFSAEGLFKPEEDAVNSQ